jgi:hypothetical protein
LNVAQLPLRRAREAVPQHGRDGVGIGSGPQRPGQRVRLRRASHAGNGVVVTRVLGRRAGRLGLQLQTEGSAGGADDGELQRIVLVRRRGLARERFVEVGRRLGRQRQNVIRRRDGGHGPVVYRWSDQLHVSQLRHTAGP